MPAASPYPSSPYSSGYDSPAPVNHSRGGGEASSFYGSSPPAVNPHQYQQQQPQQVQYDAQGNPIPMDGERGLGTMAVGGMTAWGANRLTGNKVGGGKSFFGGAILAQVGKKVYEKMDDKKHGKHGKHGE